ncbi:hypothetical protein [Xenorhabdus griffiniae]|nr:hypothetical protein [Xenorhabdus griffiniae]
MSLSEAGDYTKWHTVHYIYMNASRLQDKNYSGIDGRLQLYIRT